MATWDTPELAARMEAIDLRAKRGRPIGSRNMRPPGEWKQRQLQAVAARMRERAAAAEVRHG